jgi:hypothetical protein
MQRIANLPSITHLLDSCWQSAAPMWMLWVYSSCQVIDSM